MGKNDQEVVRAVLKGDKDAFGSLVVRHSPRLFRVAFRITGNRADAEDVVQEAVLRGYRRLEGFEARSDFGTWIYRIAVRCALDRLDRREPAAPDNADDREPETLRIADSAAGPDRLLLSGEIGALQQLALRSLTPVEKTAFILRHMEDAGTEEIAAALGIAPNAAKQAVFRAVQKIRQRLAVLRVRK
jgi:RNA polymerase sigma-70 factor, ECF subfamily